MKSFGVREMTYRLMFIANSVVSNDVKTVSILAVILEPAFVEPALFLL